MYTCISTPQGTHSIWVTSEHIYVHTTNDILDGVLRVTRRCLLMPANRQHRLNSRTYKQGGHQGASPNAQARIRPPKRR